MDLAQQATEVVDLFDCVGGQHDVDGGGRDLTEVGQIGGVALHADLSGFGARTHLGDALYIGVNGDCFRTGCGECD